jgi:tetratricopeptide (TPR) repeat protein
MSTQHNPLDTAEPHLQELASKFLTALEAHRRNDVDRSKELLDEILKVEPRLAEPRLQLGRIHLDTGRLQDAEIETREALRLVLAGGRWVEDLTDEVLTSTAHGQLAEILRQRADSDEVLFGDPKVFHAMVAEARDHFAKAQALDPENEHASYYAHYLGPDVTLPGEDRD